MKLILHAITLTSPIIGTEGMNLRSTLFNHKHDEPSAVIDSTNFEASEVVVVVNDAPPSPADNTNRQRELSNCWTETDPDPAWHPVYSAGWTEGHCTFRVDCNTPSYSTELACCKGAYGGQVSGYCLNQLPNPPTTSPTESGGLDVWYPDYDTAWSEAYCINTRPLPSGRPSYSTMLACCKGAYGGQVSGKCISMLPTPPTSSPTTSDFEAGFWYPDYDTAWPEAGCSNKVPLPFNNPNDRPQYQTQLACCKGAYGGQVSGACLSQLPSPPTTSPTGSGGAEFWYPDYDTAWTDAGCSNSLPLPFLPGGRPTYSSQLACCKAAYAGQMSGACVSGLANPPTQSPTATGEEGTGWYVLWGNWADGVCINDAPKPNNGSPTYDTKTECCQGQYGNQESDACMCDADPCHSCKCTGSGSWKDGATYQAYNADGDKAWIGANCPDLKLSSGDASGYYQCS